MSGLTFAPVWPWPVCLSAIAAAGVAVWFAYRPRSRGGAWPPTALRLATVAMTGLLLLRPSLRLPEPPGERPVVHILGDATRSMTVRDEPNGASRREALLATLSEASSAFASLADGAEVRFHDFGDGLGEPVLDDDELSAEPTGQRTAIGRSLRAIAEAVSPRRADVVVLLSDGAERDPPGGGDLRPVARRLAEASVPVYAVPFGKDDASAAGLDLRIESLAVDPVVFARKTVPVVATLRADGAAGRPLTVRLLVEDRTGLQADEAGPLRPAVGTARTPAAATVTPTDGAVTVPLELAFVPERAGEVAVGVEVETLEGERLAINNRRETLVTVRTGGIRVAYIDRPRPEQKFVRRVGAAGQIEIDYVPLFGTGPLAGEKLTGGEYDAFVIGDISPETLGPEATAVIAARASEGAGVMFTGGLTAFGTRGWRGTTLATYAPAFPASGAQRTEPLPFAPTRLGLQRYVLRVTDAVAGDDDAGWDWSKLPPLEGANRLRPASPLVEVWATAGGETPLLFAAEVGRARVLAFAGDTTYLWALGGFESVHELFWRQTILWLTRKDEELSDVWATTEPRVVAAGEPVAVRFGRTGADDEAVTFRVETRSAEGGWREVADGLTGRTSSDGLTGRFVFDAPDAMGNRPVRVSAVGESGRVVGSAVTRYLIRSRDLELERPAADPRAMAELASLTGGRVVERGEFSSLIAGFARNPPRLDPRNLSRSETLWDRPWVLIGILCLLTTEWVVRKRRGMV